MADQQLHLFQDWGPENEHQRLVGKQWISHIKGNLSRMSDPRFMGTEQRRRMGDPRHSVLGPQFQADEA